MLRAGGHLVLEEQRDPSMGPSARLDIVEFASTAGGPATYDVSVVTPLRDDASFVAHCAHEHRVDFGTLPPSVGLDFRRRFPNNL